ncbi:MAG: efflux RND transporter periplasmic adaptor subunit [candidate division Zixibacteria bacterium]|nr:efflux RND transporter periplasmic adaptor subunit [candidate division Zixibacteria bacterium]
MKRILFFISLSFVIFLLAGCDGDEGPQIDLESAVPVKVEDIKSRSIKEFVFATGTVEAVTGGDMNALQQGAYHIQVNPRTGQSYVMGDRVSQMETIILLENPELEYNIAIDSKKLNYDIAKREFEKQQKLYEKGGVTLRELTDSESRYINAKYSLDDANLQLLKLNAMAPCNGIITDLPFHANNKLIPIGTLLGKVKNYSVLYSDITLPGKEISRVKPGQTVVMSNYGEEVDSITGTITQVSPVVDPENRMFKARIEVNNTSDILRPGMFVKVNIIVAENDSTIVIPKEIILDYHGSQVVYIVQEGIAVRRDIETGLANRDEIEVVSGLSLKERLIIEGFETLRHRSNVITMK